MLTGKIHDLAYLRLSHLICKDSTFAHTVIVNVQHDASGRFAVFRKNRSRIMNDENPSAYNRHSTAAEHGTDSTFGFWLRACDYGGATV